MNTVSLLMPVKTMQIAINSMETVAKGAFSNYGTVLWVCVGLKFCYEALQQNKVGWDFIICKSYVTPKFFILCTFRWCIRFYTFDIIYTTCVPNGLVRNYSDIFQWTCNLNQSAVRRLRRVFDII